MKNFEEMILEKLNNLETRINTLEGKGENNSEIRKDIKHYIISPDKVEEGHLALVGKYKSEDSSMQASFSDDYIEISSLFKSDSSEMAKVIDAFSSEERINIVKELIQNTLSAKELMDRLKFPSTGKLYHHLSFLEKIGVIRKDGESFHVSAKYISCIVLIFTGVTKIIRKNNES